MKKDMQMKFRKVNSVSYTANSTRNLILRQQFALKYYDTVFRKKRILNCDETWIGMSDFRRMKWQFSGYTNSVAHLQIVPRISMIAGLDTKGNLYFSLV